MPLLWKEDKGGGMMERLTEKVFGFVQLKACGNDFCKETCAEHDEEKSCKNCPIQKAFEKLAEYEDLDEQGLLLQLPCKVGDTIYEVSYENGEFVIKEHIVEEFIYRTHSFPRIEIYCENENDSLMCNNIGKFSEFLFLTRAEAEKRLKAMESD